MMTWWTCAGSDGRISRLSRRARARTSTPSARECRHHDAARINLAQALGPAIAGVLVAQAALVGDKHKFISALISPNFAALEEWARHNGIYAPTRSVLVSHAKVVALYSEIVREANAGLANFETVKRFRVVPEEWSLDSGELTPSMKLKRRVITERYAAVVAAFYADEATARAEYKAASRPPAFHRTQSHLH